VSDKGLDRPKSKSTHRLAGVLLQLAYCLESHVLVVWPLNRWLGLVLLAGILVVLLETWPRLWPAALLAVLFATYVVFLAWAARQAYVRFEPRRSARQRDARPPDATNPSMSLETAPVRAAGWSGVEGKEHYYVGVEAHLERTGLGEYIVKSRVQPSRFLGLGSIPADRIGWWYIFFRPEKVLAMDQGRLYTGLRSQPALRLTYVEERGPERVLHLAFDDPVVRRRIWAHLVHHISSADGDSAAGG
jgi:hypothetical protein